ncbi:MAG: YkgJ family cysteine cluster protein [Deltaproteobacteria bacterium]|jgi:hypothetical protein|nr:YkgJ family cysteine cluster protein [Deltaproteobacteria bacterium]MBW2571277.1 YkgJ family cysteine cluster protein [Deltaproteobacteria bacterium]MBW2668823.1 YkgJ family cysteine cluster protein [Deltaproteobacteria bacterium]
MKKLYNRSYFFDQGLRFECKRCGVCCTGDPGIIYIDKNEVARIAEYISVRDSRFIEKYLYPVRAGYSIRERADGRCLFYQDGCSIYPVRPSQCKTFPFWFENLRSSRIWRQVARECPGIGCGSLYSKEQILEIVQLKMEAVDKSYFCKIRDDTKNQEYQPHQDYNTEVSNGRN